MGLKLTLKPNEKIVINGCVIRNSNRRQSLTIENQADVIRGVDLLDENSAVTPTSEIYFLVQSAMLNSEIRDDLTIVIQKRLGKLVPVFHQEIGSHLIEAANHVSARNYYQALRSIKPVMKYEAELLQMFGDQEQTAIPAE